MTEKLDRRAIRWLAKSRFFSQIGFTAQEFHPLRSCDGLTKLLNFAFALARVSWPAVDYPIHRFPSMFVFGRSW